MNIKYYYRTESQYVKCPNYMKKYYGYGVTECYPKFQQFFRFHLWLLKWFLSLLNSSEFWFRTDSEPAL